MSSGELLDIQPQELQFPFELRKQISCSLQLSNKTDNYVAFKVKTTNPEKYCACPDTEVLLPRSTCDVTVTMQAQKEAPADLQCKDIFLLQSVVASPGTTTKDINPEMFNREPECQLKVVYVAPPRPPSPVREGSDEDSSPGVSVSENGHSYVELPGLSATGEQILDQLKGLGGMITRMFDGKINNNGKQIMKGMSNYTGSIQGDNNGAIDFRGELKIFLDMTTRGREISDPPQPSQSCISTPPPPPPLPPPTSASPGSQHYMGGGLEFSGSSSSYSSVMQGRKYYCKCDVESPLMTYKTPENYGRRFYGCGQLKRYGKKLCDFIIWVDEDMTEQQKTVELPAKITNKLEKKVEHAKRIEDELKMKLKFLLSLMIFFLVIVIVLVFAQVFVCTIVATQLLK